MNRRDDTNGSSSGRMQWGSYGFIAGILIGVLMGWFFAGFIGAFVRIAMVALAVAPLVLLFIAWRRYVVPFLRPPVEQNYSGPVTAIETRAIVHGTVSEPRSR